MLEGDGRRAKEVDVTVLRSLVRWVVAGCLATLASTALAQPSAYQDAMARRDATIEELERYEQLLAPPGTVYILDIERWSTDPGDAFWTTVRWVSAEELAVRLLERNVGNDPAPIAHELRSLLLDHVRIQHLLEARIDALRAEVAALDDVVIDALARAGSPSTYDWHLTGEWRAAVPEGWDLANLDDLSATLSVPSLTGDAPPTLTLRITNLHFVPGWNATASLRPREVDLAAMREGNALTTIYPVGSFDGPLGPRSLAPEDTEPGDRVDHRCEAWNEPGGIGRIHVVDPGGPDERLEMELRFEGVHCDDGVPVQVFLTFRR
jgi:hypothetical protein